MVFMNWMWVWILWLEWMLFVMQYVLKAILKEYATENICLNIKYTPPVDLRDVA